MDDLKKIEKLLSKAEQDLFKAPEQLTKLYTERQDLVTRHERELGFKAGEERYKETVGDTIGGGLHKAGAGQVSEEKLIAHADKAVEGGLKALAGEMKALGGNVTDDDCDKLAEALVAQFGGAGGDFLKADGKGLVDNVQNTINENPELVATAAVLGGIAAVVANMEIPELAAKLGLAEGLDVEFAVQLGRIRDIALEKVKTKLAYTNQMLEASIAVETHSPTVDPKFAAAMDIKIRPNDMLSIHAFGKASELDGNSFGVGVDFQAKSNLSVGLDFEKTKDDQRVGVGVKWTF